ADAPGYTALTVTTGGAISGYCAMGRLRIADRPASARSPESTAAKIGRSMKKRENMDLVYPSGYAYFCVGGAGCEAAAAGAGGGGCAGAAAGAGAFGAAGLALGDAGVTAFPAGAAPGAGALVITPPLGVGAVAAILI